jgi:hypothetical protein
MPVLSKDHRTLLGKAILKARRAAERGAKKALDYLAVPESKFHDSMSEHDRDLRRKLRARGRQLGDKRNFDGSQSVNRLTHEVAYEQWHRMLFARFLAENNLLLHPEIKVAVSLEEVEELARETGEDPWMLAARYAQNTLPQIFRSGDPVLDVTLATEIRVELEGILSSLPAEVFSADDSLGWTYQYWQSEKKDAVNESGDKIGADDLPAVTQLFTEHYMVLFLYHNTIGAWHAGKVLAENPNLAEAAKSEEELRQAVKLNAKGGYDFEYLRFVREAKEGDEDDQPTGPWRPAGGTFEGWPKTAKELKVLDPCCGSGHFLTEGFEILVCLRMDEEGLGLDEAICAVFTDNLHGLELDPRCTQIAAFNVGLTAWKLAGKLFELPPLHIACSGMAVGASKEDWSNLAGENERLRVGMERLYDLFEQAPELGSLIDPNSIENELYSWNSSFAELQPLFEKAIAEEKKDAEVEERAIAAHGMVRAAELLSDEYTLVITNVPYLKSGEQSKSLKSYCASEYPDAKYDLATVMSSRCLRSLAKGGTSAIVCQQYWTFLKYYQRLRADHLSRYQFSLIARLGPGAFQAIKGAVVNICLQIMTREIPAKKFIHGGIEIDHILNFDAKVKTLREGLLHFSTQADHLLNPDHRISFEKAPSHQGLLSEIADFGKGSVSGDGPQYIRKFWEINQLSNNHKLWLNSPSHSSLWSGREDVILWGVGNYNPEMQIGFRHHGHRVFGRKGVAIGKAGRLRFTPYLGELFDDNVAVLCPNEDSQLEQVWTFCRSEEFLSELRRLDKKMSVTAGTFTKVACSPRNWESEEANLLIRVPQSNDPTQWLFHGHPAKADKETALQVAAGRLLGYQWPPELDPEMLLSGEAREWVAKCESLNDFADEDGIVCLFATNNEKPAAERLRELLAAAFGSEWSPAKEEELLEAADVSTTLDVWLRDKLFEEHCKLFKHRPFIWHLWDGNRSGFHCLVNAHKLTGDEGEGRRTLEAITFTYLGDWIERQKADVAEEKEGAEARLAAAQDLQSQLKKILEGEPPYDIFVRWKAINEQAIGWGPDINDGIRLNIRPFMKAELQTGGKRGAGLLRWKPNIHWKKYCGKELMTLRPRAEYPWFWGCDDSESLEDRTDVTGTVDFDGNRWNDLHCSITAKQQARTEEEVS